MTTWFEREQAYQARLNKAYDERRVVKPELTLAQARAVVEYLNRKHETEPFSTTLCMAIREIERATP